MIILGIETSCDETAAAVVEDGVKILSNVVASSQELHTKTGGIIPEMAARQQVVSMIPVLQECLRIAKLKSQDLNSIAVTYGPGLIGSLLVGVETAKTLSLIWEKPLIPVNHLVGHIYANFVGENSKSKVQNPKFPALALVVSGGHTDLVLMKDHGSLTWISGTRDDAAGEAFDKTARLLGLPYPGGPAIAAEAAKFQTQNPKFKYKLFPRPLIDQDTFDWSFSGLKTAVLREIQSSPTTLALRRVELAAETQEAIVDVLVNKTLKAARAYGVDTILLAGGVAANQRLKSKFLSEIKSKGDNLHLHVPDPGLCTDNAAVIASAAYFNFYPIDWKGVDANPNLTITS